MLISLETIKNHLRLDCDIDSETDPELKRMYHAALEYVMSFTDCALDDLLVPCISEQKLKPSVEQAILLMIGDFYENREALTDKKLTHSAHTTVERLLHFHRDHLGV